MRIQGSHVVPAAILFGAGFVVGQLGMFDSPVDAQQRTRQAADERKPFLSGGEQSNLTLKEIHKTLQQMDQRLVAIEKSTAQIAKLRSSE